MSIITAWLGKNLLSLKPMCSFLSVLSPSLLSSFSACPWSVFSSQSLKVFCLTLQPDRVLREAYAGRMRAPLSAHEF